MSYVALDFETANRDRASACSVGVAVFESGRLVERNSWLIRPPRLYFERFNTAIHGISADDVRDEPEFEDLWDDLNYYLKQGPIVAHNASFDISVLRHTLEVYDLPFPTTDYFCTVTLSRAVWPELLSHRLNVVSDFLGIELQHHDAEEDAVACGFIAANACRSTSACDLYELSEMIGSRVGKLFPGGYLPASRKAKTSRRPAYIPAAIRNAR